MADKYELMEKFQTILKENYGAPAQNMDFSLDVSRISINKWVEDFTKQRIKELLPPGIKKNQIMYKFDQISNRINKGMSLPFQERLIPCQNWFW